MLRKYLKTVTYIIYHITKDIDIISLYDIRANPDVISSFQQVSYREKLKSFSVVHLDIKSRNCVYF